MYDCCSQTEDRGSQNSRRAESIASTNRHQAQNPDQQVGKAHLQLERTTGGPTYPLCDQIGKENVAESPADSIGTNTDGQYIDDESFNATRWCARLFAEQYVTGRQQQGQKRIGENSYKK